MEFLMNYPQVLHFVSGTWDMRLDRRPSPPKRRRGGQLMSAINISSILFPKLFFLVAATLLSFTITIKYKQTESILHRSVGINIYTDASLLASVVKNLWNFGHFSSIDKWFSESLKIPLSTTKSRIFKFSKVNFTFVSDSRAVRALFSLLVTGGGEERVWRGQDNIIIAGRALRILKC